MATKSIAVSIVADVKELQNNLKKAEGSVGDFAKDVDKNADKARLSMESVAEGADHTASAASQAAGGMGDLGGALSLLPGPLGKIGTGMESLAPVIMGVTGASDLLNLATEKLGLKTLWAKTQTVAKTVAEKAAAVATKAFAVAQAALNAVMSANPIALVVLAIVGLVAAFIIAYKKSETFRNIVNGAFQAVLKVVTTVAKALWSVIKTAFNIIKTVITTYIKVYVTVIRTAFNIIKNVFSGAWSIITKGVRGAWSGIKSVVTNGVSGVVNLVRSIPGKLAAIGGAFANAGRTLIGKFFDGLKKLGSIGVNVGHSLINGVINGINAGINLVNNIIPNHIGLGKLGFDIPANPFPTIPHLASGGITTGPTLALIGDNPGGREAVIPLDKYDPFGAKAVHVTVNAGIGGNPKQIAKEIKYYLGLAV